MARVPFPEVLTPAPVESAPPTVQAIPSSSVAVSTLTDAAARPQQPASYTPSPPVAPPVVQQSAPYQYPAGATLPYSTPDMGASPSPSQDSGYGDGLDHSSPQAFAASLAPAAQRVQAATGVPSSILTAIPLNEAGWRDPAPGNAYYGIKGSGTGAVDTWEDYGGGRQNIKDSFRAYDTPEQAMQDFVSFLDTNARYKRAMADFRQSGDAAKLVRDIHAAGYATDPAWSDKVLRQAYDLEQQGVASAPQPAKFRTLSAAGLGAPGTAAIPPVDSGPSQAPTTQYGPDGNPIATPEQLAAFAPILDQSNPASPLSVFTTVSGAYDDAVKAAQQEQARQDTLAANGGNSIGQQQQAEGSGVPGSRGALGSTLPEELVAGQQQGIVPTPQNAPGLDWQNIGAGAATGAALGIPGGIPGMVVGGLLGGGMAAFPQPFQAVGSALGDLPVPFPGRTDTIAQALAPTQEYIVKPWEGFVDALTAPEVDFLWAQMAPGLHNPLDDASRSLDDVKATLAGIGGQTGLTPYQYFKTRQETRTNTNPIAALAGMLADPANLAFAAAGERVARGAELARDRLPDMRTALTTIGSTLDRTGQPVADTLNRGADSVERGVVGLKTLVSRLGEGLPPVKDGDVRLFRGESVLPGQETVPARRSELYGTETAGRWFTPDRATAEDFQDTARQFEGRGYLTYVDVPKAVADQYAAGIKTHVLLPQDLVDTRQQVPPSLVKMVVNRLTGIDPATGRRYATMGAARFGSAADDRLKANYDELAKTSDLMASAQSPRVQDALQAKADALWEQQTKLEPLAQQAGELHAQIEGWTAAADESPVRPYVKLAQTFNSDQSETVPLATYRALMGDDKAQPPERSIVRTPGQPDRVKTYVALDEIANDLHANGQLPGNAAQATDTFVREVQKVVDLRQRAAEAKASLAELDQQVRAIAQPVGLASGQNGAARAQGQAALPDAAKPGGAAKPRIAGEEAQIGRWFTPDYREASVYNTEAGSGDIIYVDIPRSSLATFTDAATQAKGNYTGLQLLPPEEIAKATPFAVGLQSTDSALKALPPVKDGYIRLYRGRSADEVASQAQAPEAPVSPEAAGPTQPLVAPPAPRTLQQALADRQQQIANLSKAASDAYDHAAGTGSAATGKRPTTATKPRQFAQSLAEVSPEFAQLLQENPMDYSPLHNTDVLNAAVRRVNADPDGTLARVLASANDPKVLSLETEADALIHLNRAAQAGDTETLQRLAEAFVPQTTTLGQQVQALSTIRKMSPEGLFLQIRREINKAVAEGQGPEVAKRIAKQANDLEIAKAKAAAAERLDAIDAARAKSAATETTIAGARAKGSGIKFNDFLKDLKGLMQESGKPGRRSAQAGRLMTRAEFEMAPEDAARFQDKALAIHDLPTPELRDLARADLLKEVQDFRNEQVKTENVQRRAQEKVQRLKDQQESGEFKRAQQNAAQAVKDAEAEHAAQLREIQRIEHNEDLFATRDENGQANAIGTAVERERALQQKAEQQQALDAEKRRNEDEAKAFRAAEAEMKRRADAAEKQNASELDATIRLSNQKTITQMRANEALAAQKADAAEASARALDAQRAAAPQQNMAALDKQRELSEAQSRGRLAAQKVNEAKADADRYDANLGFLTDAEARAAKEIVKQELSTQTTALGKRIVRENDLRLSPEQATHFLDMSKALDAIPADDYHGRLRMQQAILNDIQKLVPPDQWQSVSDALNLPRSLSAGFDLSFGLNQGIRSAFAHPQAFLAMERANIGALASEEVATAVDREILNNPLRRMGTEAGLDFVDRFGPISQGEETFMNRWVGKIPGGKQSERAYVTAGNKFRSDLWTDKVLSWLPENMRDHTFTSLDELAQATGKSVDDLKRLATWYNVSTGRGVLPKSWTSNNKWINAAFFAPRFLASEVEYPWLAAKYGIGSPALRATIARDLVGYVGGNMAVLYLASKIPGVSVSTDPSSSDFGQIRWGNSRINFWGGEVALARFVGQMITGHRTTATGSTEDYPRGQQLLDFLRGRLSTYPGIAWDIAARHDPVGNRMDNLKDIDVAIASAHIPFLVSDIYNAVKADGPAAGAVIAPISLFGGRTNTYDSVRSEQDRMAKLYFGKAYTDILNRNDRAAVNNSKAVQEQVALQAQKMGVDPRAQVQTSMDNFANRQKELETGLRKTIDAGISGPDFEKQVQKLLDARTEDSQLTYHNLAVTALAAGAAPVNQGELLRQAYWSAQPAVDDATGTVDWSVQKQARAAVLQQAAQAGIPAKDITDRGPQYTDAKVQAAVDHHRELQDTAAQYYDYRDGFFKQYPQAKTVYDQYVAALKSGDQRMANVYAKQESFLFLSKSLDNFRATHPDVDKAAVALGYLRPKAPKGVPADSPAGQAALAGAAARTPVLAGAGR